MPELTLAEAFRFCPYCGTRYEPASRIGARPSGKRCAACGHEFYFNAAPTVAAVIVRDGATLLGRRAVEPFRGDYSLPGGFAEEDEEPEETLRRELHEETGLEVVHAELLGVYRGFYTGRVRRWTFNASYLVTETRGEPRAASDVAELTWFPLDALPPNLPFPDNRAALAEARRRLERR